MNNENVIGIEFKDILKAVKRRFYIIILIVTPAILLSIYYVTYKITPSYEATTRIIIGNPLGQQGMQFSIEDVANIEELMPTYSALIKHTAVSKKVIKKLNMKIMPDSLQSSIIATPQAATQFMDLKLVWTNSGDAVKILDTFTEVYIAEVRNLYSTYAIQVMEKAKISRIIIPSNKKLYIPLGLFTGAAISFMLIFALEFMDNTLKSEEDVKASLKLAVLGVIPKQKRKIKKISLEITQKLDFAFKEAYRTLRTNIHFAAHGENMRTIIVTSGRPGEGKTTAASMLSTAMAQAGGKTILLDCDLRKPEIHNLFEMRQKGLANILAGGMKWRDVVQKSDIENLDIITAGFCPSNPSELLSLKSMKELIEALEKEYVHIILDTPPVGLVTDAQILSLYADGYVFVVSSQKTKTDDALKAISLIQHTNGKILGVLINGMRDMPSYRLYKHYSKAKAQKARLKAIKKLDNMDILNINSSDASVMNKQMAVTEVSN